MELAGLMPEKCTNNLGHARRPPARTRAHHAVQQHRIDAHRPAGPARLIFGRGSGREPLGGAKEVVRFDIAVLQIKSCVLALPRKRRGQP